MTGHETNLPDEVARSLVEIEKTAGGVVASFRFEKSLSVFRGHFPDLALVPGVYLLEAVRVAVGRAAGTAVRIGEVVDVKFTAQVRPGDTVCVEAEYATDATDASGWTCQAVLSRDEEVAARVKMTLVLEEGRGNAGA